MFKKLSSFLFENKTTRQTVAKNTIWLSVTNFGGRLIRAAIVIYGARVLGTAEWGVFSYAVTLSAFLALYVDPGLNAILTREGSKSDDTNRRVIFSTILILKVVLLVFAAFFIIFVGPYFSTLPGAKELLPIVAIILAFDILRDFLMALVRSLEKMEWEAGVFLLTNLAVVAFGFVFLFFKPTAQSFGWAYVCGDAVGLIAAIIILRKYFAGLFAHVNPKRVLPLLRSAWPFAVTGALGLLLTNTDILIISWLRSVSEVGIYSAAIRIVQVIYLVPVIIQLSALPLFSRLARTEPAKFRIALEHAVGIIFLASIPLAIGGVILGTPIMGIVFGGAFSPGGLPFKILMITLLFDFPATVISAAIFAHDHQKSLIVCSLIGAVSNVALDLLLIPRYGMTGSAVATLIANILSNWYLWRTMRKLNYFEMIPHLRKIIVGGAAMGVVTTLLFVFHVNTIVNIAVSAGVYFFILYQLREPLLLEVKRVLAGAGLTGGEPTSPGPRTTVS